MKEPTPISIEMIFNPEKFGKAPCPHCNGYGSSLKEKEDRCTLCGGSGLVDTAIKEVYNKGVGK